MTINRKFRLTRKNMKGGSNNNYVFLNSTGEEINPKTQSALLESFSSKKSSKSSKSSKNTSKNTSKKSSKFNAREYSVKSRRNNASASVSVNDNLAPLLSKISISESTKGLPPSTGNDPSIDGYYENSYFLAEENIPNGDCAYYTLARGIDLLLNNLYGGSPNTNKIPGKTYVDIGTNNPHLWDNNNTGSYYRFHYHFVASNFRQYLKTLLNEKSPRLGDNIFGMRNRAQRGANVIRNNHSKTGTFADSFQLGAMSCIFNINLCICQVSEESHNVLNKTWMLFEPTECLEALISETEPGRLLEIISNINPLSSDNIESQILMGLIEGEENYMVAQKSFITNPTLFIWNSDNGHYKLMIPKMIGLDKIPFKLYREYYEKSSTIIPRWGNNIRIRAQSSKNLHNLLKIFSVNGIENGKRADNFDLVVKSMPKNLSHNQVDLIREELDVNKRNPNQVIGLLFQMLEEAAGAEPKSKKNSRKSKAEPAPSRMSKKSSWKDVVKQIEEKLKIKLLPKEINFIKNEVTNKNTKPEMLFKIPFEGTKLPKPPPLLPSVLKNKSKKNNNFKTKIIKSMKNFKSLKENALKKFKKEKLKDLGLKFSDDNILLALEIANFDFDETLNILLTNTYA